MSVSVGSLVFIVAFLATTALAVVAAFWVARRRRDQELRAHGSPLLVMSSGDGSAYTETRSRVRHTPISFSVATVSPNEVVVHPGPPIEDPVTATTGRFAPGTIGAEVVHGHSLRFHRPPDGTLAFYPASLQVIGGPDAGHEVRFVQPEPGVSPDITFGRKEGPPYRHVQLLEPTVSRTHARLSPDGSGWRVVNLSRTNPVVVNGEAITGVDSWHQLANDDLIEMGALVFRFHSGEPGRDRQ